MAEADLWAGTGDTVKALLYVAAFQPGKGQTLGELPQRFPMKVSLKMVGTAHFVPDPAAYQERSGQSAHGCCERGRPGTTLAVK
jgi:hypothetical protein